MLDTVLQGDLMEETNTFDGRWEGQAYPGKHHLKLSLCPNMKKYDGGFEWFENTSLEELIRKDKYIIYC